MYTNYSITIVYMHAFTYTVVKLYSYMCVPSYAYLMPVIKLWALNEEMLSLFTNSLYKPSINICDPSASSKYKATVDYYFPYEHNQLVQLYFIRYFTFRFLLDFYTM